MELQNVTHITSQSRIRKLGENEEMIISYAEQRTVPRILCNGNGAIFHLQTETGFFEDFRCSLYNW